jgi:hypothetical protein
MVWLIMIAVAIVAVEKLGYFDEEGTCGERGR